MSSDTDAQDVASMTKRATERVPSKYTLRLSFGRASGLACTIALHLAVFFIAIWIMHGSIHNTEVVLPVLQSFDVPLLPPPEPQHLPEPDTKLVPVRPKPEPERIAATRSGSPRPARSPIMAASSIQRPAVLDFTMAPSAPPVPIAGADERAAPGLSGNISSSGVGTGGSGTGNGNGDGSAPSPAVRGAQWIRHPSPAELLRYWPERAKQQKISGTVMLWCIVPRPGPPRKCWIDSGTPAGEGFGDATMRMSPTFRIRPVTGDRSMATAPLRIPIVFAALDQNTLKNGRRARSRR